MDNFDISEMMSELGKRLKPYNDSEPSYRKLPESGFDMDNLLDFLRRFSESENRSWKNGKVSGAVYHGGDELLGFLDQVYHLYSQANPLHPDIWPSLTKFENEIVSMSSSIMNGDGSVRGAVTSGGTESILLAMKTYRDYYRSTKGITDPEIILPTSAHAAFLKACDYFCIKPVFVDLDENYVADTEKIRELITPNTIALVGSAPSFPYGTMDPIEEMSKIAQEYNVGMHVDACLGGFIIPWAEKLGFHTGRFDFSLPGVTSISMDTHKYGYGPKGTSVVLYRNSDLFQQQIYATGTWQGGIYFTPTIAGSRPGYPIVAAWAVMLLMGEKGYRESSKKILETGKFLKEKIAEINDLKILGNPLWVISMSSDTLDPYAVSDLMGKRGWMLSGLTNPPAFHIALTIRHTYPGVKEEFIRDLKESVTEAKFAGKSNGGMAPVYGMASALPEEQVRFFLKNIVEWLYSQ